MIFAAAGYAYPNAKVRALRSRRLTAQDRHFLLEARDFFSFLAYLVTTPYGRVLPDLGEEKTDPGVLERRLARSLMEDYAKVARSLRGQREQELVLALFSRFESENLIMGDVMGDNGGRGYIMKLCQIFAYNFWSVIPVKGVEVGDE